ncbi:pleckstrin homology domain-containing family G member 7 [Tiliqua scincoides]|uniref:pleckstrin homology domain-containing family G member 7 n=1 Tax=Tiliqua scincoides TaxID=71010 RepID=UPI00346305D3
MQKPVTKYSFEVSEETNIEEQCYILKVTEPWEDNLDVIGKNDLENDVFSSYDVEMKLCPTDTKRRYGFSDHLLKVPSMEYDDGDTICQFDRHAPARISTSPTLRRLRNSTPSISQVFPLQDDPASTPPGNQKQRSDSFVPVCQAPPLCSEQLSSSSNTNSLLPKDNCTSLDTMHIFSRQKDGFSGYQTLQGKGELNASSPSEEQNPQECVQQDVKSSSPFSFMKNNLSCLTFFQTLETHNASLSCSAGRRHSSVVVSLPGLEMFPGDLMISDSAAEFLYSSASQQCAESKKPWWPFAKKGNSKDKRKQISDLENCLSALTIDISECSGYEFHSVKDKAWHEITKIHQVDQKAPDDPLDRKKKEAIWELFTTECTYLLDHLLVLKMIFMNTLKYLQSKEFLPDVDCGLLFANLEELNQVSLSFVTSFFSDIKDHLVNPTSSLDFIPVLTKYFQGNLCQSHQMYCLNYTSAVFYLEKLKKREDFGVYLKWCERNEQCQRRRLSELLVAPLHKLTRYPLLLKNIWKNTDTAEKAIISSIKEKVEKSIRDLEGKVKWLDNFQKFKQLQDILIWPPLWDQDKRFFVPECLKHVLRDNPNENILSPTKRSLLHEGRLTLAEHMRLIDVYLFLFDDLLLITKPNRHKKKAGASDASLISVCPFLTPELQSLVQEGGSCTVLDQPIPLDRLILKNIDSFHVTVVGLQNTFLIQHENRYQQYIAVFLLQAQTEAVKKAWISQIQTAISDFAKRHIPPHNAFLSLPAESSEI